MKFNIKFLALVIAIAFVLGGCTCNTSRNMRMFIFTEGRGFYLFEIMDEYVFKFQEVEFDFRREYGILDDFILKFPTAHESIFWGATLYNERELQLSEEERNDVLNLVENVRINRSDRNFEGLLIAGEAGIHDYVFAIIDGRTYWSSLSVYRHELNIVYGNIADFVNEDLLQLVEMLSYLAQIDLNLRIP